MTGFVRLGPFRSSCEVDGQTLVLDLCRDRYWQLGERLALALARATRDPVEHEPGDLHRLRQAGLLSGLDIPIRDTGAKLLPPQSSVLDAQCPFRAAHAVTAARYLAATSLALRRKRLHLIVDHLRREIAPPDARCSDQELSELCVTLYRIVRVFGWEGRCLLHGLSLARLLAARGIGATLVIGVTIRPFAAHCWVQHGGLVLTDTADSVAKYTPILIV